MLKLIYQYFTAGMYGRALIRKGWRLNGTGRWESPNRSDFRTYNTYEAYKKEFFGLRP